MCGGNFRCHLYAMKAEMAREGETGERGMERREEWNREEKGEMEEKREGEREGGREETTHSHCAVQFTQLPAPHVAVVSYHHLPACHPSFYLFLMCFVAI